MPKSQFQNAIAVYINGSFKGKWLVEDCEERRRFFCCKKRTLVKEKDFKACGIRSKKGKKNLLTDTLTTSIFRIGQTLVK